MLDQAQLTNLPSSGTASRPSEKHIPELDGIRGIAILLVLVVHSSVVFAEPPHAPHWVMKLMNLGWSGVDLFFVLSGFLITGILLDTRVSPKYFKRFYLRRILRIFPLYFVYLFLVLVVARFIFVKVGLGDPWRATNFWGYFAYIANLLPGHGFHDPFLDHIWSLCVEEQFYLVWPFLIYFTRPKLLPWICVVLVAASPLIRLGFYTAGMDGFAIYRLTFARLDALALGALAAISLRRWPGVLKAWCGPLSVASFFGIAIMAVLSKTTNWDTPLIGILGTSLLAAFYAGLVGFTVSVKIPALSRFMSGKALTLIGRRSYGMYVLHWMPLVLTAALWNNLSLPLKFLYLPWITGVTFILAEFSWVFLESRFMALRRFVR